MSSYADALLVFYGGEVAGEAFYSALVGSARNDVERLKWATLLQLETETKAWLRGPTLAHGVSIEERASDRDNAIKSAERFKQLSWTVQMKRLHDALADEFLPRYERYADEARARGNAGEETVCRFMVEHEKAQVEFVQRELTGAGGAESLEPIEHLLKYPVRLRSRESL